MQLIRKKGVRYLNDFRLPNALKWVQGVEQWRAKIQLHSTLTAYKSKIKHRIRDYLYKDEWTFIDDR